MSTVNDARYTKLTGLGHSGSLNDITLKWLKAQGGATSDNLNDAWMQMLDARVAGSGTRNDKWYALLGTLGHSGTLNDREYSYWTGANGGVLPAP